MDCWTYYSRTLSTILWHPDCARRSRNVAIRERVEHLIREHGLDIDSKDLSIPQNEIAADPRTIVVRPAGAVDFGRCPGTHGHHCCNYLTLNVYAGCTLGCTYCIMQSYLRNRTLEVLLPEEQQLNRIRATARDQPRRTIRVGTGEVGDSLLYDPLFGISEILIHELRDIENLQFELKTKTDYVDHLPRLHSPRFVVGFSLNPPGMIAAEEGWAATLQERLAAAHRAAKRGYRVAFHFDPLILHGRWREEYGAVADQLGAFSDTSPAWISLGTLRFPPSLRSAVERRPYALQEFVQARDGKMRYLQPVRAEMYRFMRDRLHAALPDAPIYLCMESAAVWRDFLRDQATARHDPGILRPILVPVTPAGGYDASTT